MGPVAVSSLRSLHVDAFFMGVHGMDVRAGFSTPNLLESETNRAMIERSRRLIVCADSSKWGVVGLSSMAGSREAAVLITDSGLSRRPAARWPTTSASWSWSTRSPTTTSTRGRPDA